MTTTTSTDNLRRHRTRWQTAAWVGLLLLGGFYLFGATNDLIADGRTGIPTDHTGTFTSMADIGWDAAQHTIPAPRRTSPCWNAATPYTNWSTPSCS